MVIHYLCKDCGIQFSETEAVQEEESLHDLQQPDATFIECRCPRCDSAQIEELANLLAVREMKGH